VLAAVAVLLLAALPASANDPNLEELVQILGHVSNVMTTLVNNGFVIEHLELDSMGVDETYRVPYPLYAGLEYIVVGIGGPAIADFDVYILDDTGELVISDTEVNQISAVTLKTAESAIHHCVFHAYSLTEGYSADVPYYFGFVIGAR